MTDIVNSKQVQDLLDTAAGINQSGGNPRVKSIMRDLLEGLMTTIEKHDISEDEFWVALKFLQDGVGEFGLIAPGVGIEHFLDLHMDAKDAEAGLEGGTPRTIEGPLYVAGAPLIEGDLSKTNDVNLTDDPDDTETMVMSGRITGPDGEQVKDAIMHVWHANSKGFYSHFDPTGTQSPFNNRRRIKLGEDGRYSFHSKMPCGYAVPPGGSADQLMKVLGRHGNRPAHVHFFIEAPGYRTLTTQINFGDDPHAHDDFAFGTREGLLPVPDRSSGSSEIHFDFKLQRAKSDGDQSFSKRARASA
ncbi:dioxygenase family protein [Hyphococcus lacteus]|uniref:Dioxygenase n=1 Tax=Hyphococcus lacteus TaxID=3143536 RepID=A0ABV3Z0K3_9PROT